MHPIIIVILLVASLLFVSWCKRAPPEQRKKGIIYALIAVVALLVVTGRMNWLMGVVATALALGQRLLMATQLFDNLKGLSGGTPGSQSSGVETAFFKMSLDHETGDMDGEILRGNHTGRKLSTLGLETLVGLFNQCVSEDQQSAAVLDAYLKRRFGDGWRDNVGGESAGSQMTMEQALGILGLRKGATRDEIVDAHRRLMQKIHPDRGGSAELASQVNRAKDVLLSA